MPHIGNRIKSIKENLTKNITQANVESGNSGADEAKAEIDRSPLPVLLKSRPDIPARPEKYRSLEQEQTPPLLPQSSSQDELHLKRREPSQTRRQLEEPRTSKDSNFSINCHPIINSSTSLSEVQDQLSSLKLEVGSLRKQLEILEKAEITLRNEITDAERKYDKAIFDLQASQTEKDVLQDVVERLRAELDRERQEKQRLQEDIDVGVRREKELWDILETKTRIEEGRVECKHSCQNPIMPKMEEQHGEQRSERRRSIHIYVEQGSRSQVGGSRKGSSKSAKEVRDSKIGLKDKRKKVLKF